MLIFHGAHLSQHGQDLAAWVPRGNGIDEIGPSYVYVKRWKGHTRGNAIVNKAESGSFAVARRRSTSTDNGQRHDSATHAAKAGSSDGGRAQGGKILRLAFVGLASAVPAPDPRRDDKADDDRGLSGTPSLPSSGASPASSTSLRGSKYPAASSPGASGDAGRDANDETEDDRPPRIRGPFWRAVAALTTLAMVGAGDGKMYRPSCRFSGLLDVFPILHRAQNMPAAKLRE